MFKKKRKKDRQARMMPLTSGGYPSGDKAIEDFRPPPRTPGAGSRPAAEQDAKNPR